MNSLVLDPVAYASTIRCTEDDLIVTFRDGRTLSVPLAWFPRLLNATAAQRATYELLGDGEGIHWPAVDEDLSVAALLTGQPSAEYGGMSKK